MSSVALKGLDEDDEDDDNDEEEREFRNPKLRFGEAWILVFTYGAAPIASWSILDEELRS
jgi:hypothetical protein